MTDLGALVTHQLRALADALEQQDDLTIGDAPSLCEGWTVRHVLAHMTMAARYDQAAFGREIAAAGGDFGRLSETVARRDAALPLDALLADLRSDTLAAWRPPGGGDLGALTHAVIHALDITVALGMPPTAGDEAMSTVLAVLVDGVARHFGVAVTGAELVLALAGRPRPGISLPVVEEA